MKKIVVIPVKNEGWILPLSLACHSLWADEIIVADQESNDNTLEICRRFEKVRVIKNTAKLFNEGERRQLLLNEARKSGPNNLIFALDADEIMSADILDKKFSDTLFQKIVAGGCLGLPWIQLIESINQYDGSASAREFKCFAYRDNGRNDFQPGFIHLPRVPEATLKKQINADSPVVLHFQAVDVDGMKAKQRYYQVLEKNNGRIKSDLKNNLIYLSARMSPQIKKSPASWLEGYEKMGVKLTVGQRGSNFWHEYILESFKAYGPKKFSGLDIWDLDWNQEAKKFGYSGRFDDPRNMPQKIFQKFYKKGALGKLLSLMVKKLSALKQAQNIKNSKPEK